MEGSRGGESAEEERGVVRIMLMGGWLRRRKFFWLDEKSKSVVLQGLLLADFGCQRS